MAELARKEAVREGGQEQEAMMAKKASAEARMEARREGVGAQEQSVFAET